MERESFGSRLGFLLVSAGCAIGIGNVWRFPYITGQDGGGLFVLIYLICLLIMGVPVLTMELAVGRASRKSAVLSYRTLEAPGQRWHIHGWFCMLGCYVLARYNEEIAALVREEFLEWRTIMEQCLVKVYGGAIGAREAEAMMILISGAFICNYNGAFTGRINGEIISCLANLSQS